MKRTDSGLRLRANPVTILFYDTDERTRCAYVEVARELGYGAETAARGDEAWAKARLLRPDVVVADIRLGDWEGFELASRLRTEPATAHIPVIGTTAVVAWDLARQALDCGCMALLTKPCSLELLARTIARALDTPDPRLAREA